MSSLGTFVGGLIHVFAAAFGLSAILASSAVAFGIVKYAGAAYLIYLGVRMIRDREVRDEVAARSSQNPFKQGIWTEVLNPKTALFFLAFPPSICLSRKRPSHATVRIPRRSFCDDEHLCGPFGCDVCWVHQRTIASESKATKAAADCFRVWDDRPWHLRRLLRNLALRITVRHVQRRSSFCRKQCQSESVRCTMVSDCARILS